MRKEIEGMGSYPTSTLQIAGVLTSIACQKLEHDAFGGLGFRVGRQFLGEDPVISCATVPRILVLSLEYLAFAVALKLWVSDLGYCIPCLRRGCAEIQCPRLAAGKPGCRP